MKKLVTLILVLAGIVGTASAENVTKRIYVISSTNFGQYRKGNLALHVWYQDGSGDVTTWGTTAEEMGLSGSGTKETAELCLWTKDISFDNTKTVQIQVYDSGNTGWTSNYDLTVNKDTPTHQYYTFDITSSNKLELRGNVSYYAYLSDGVSTWTKQTLSTEDGFVFTTTIDNQTSFNDKTELLIAPSFAVDDELVKDNDGKRFTWMFRPWDENQDFGFATQTNLYGGFYSNTNSLKLKCNAFYDLSYKPCDWSYSINPYITRTINPSVGYATFSSAYDVAVAGATAYYCTGIDGSKELVMSTFSDGIPANQGALLQGSGDVTFTPAASPLVAPGTNWLKPGTGKTVPQTDGAGNTNFILTNKTVSGSADLKFYKVNSDGNTVATGKAYLQIPSAYVGAHEYFWFEDETTGIEAAKASQKMNGEFFNLAGQRVAQPAKGLYIANGKKVIMK